MGIWFLKTVPRSLARTSDERIFLYHACIAITEVCVGYGEVRMDLLDRLLGHDRWTTARLLNLSRGLTDVQLDQPFDVGHQSLRTTFAT